MATNPPPGDPNAPTPWPGQPQQQAFWPPQPPPPAIDPQTGQPYPPQPYQPQAGYPPQGGYPPQPYPPPGYPPQPGYPPPPVPDPMTGYQQPGYPPPPGMPAAAPDYLGRIRNICLQPQAEWPRIDAEPATIQDLVVRWLLPFAAIAPTAHLIGNQMFGFSAGQGIHVQPSFGFSFGQGLVDYGVAVVFGVALAYAVSWLAGQNGGVANPVQAMKVVVYSFLPAMITGAFQAVPAIGFLQLAGLWSFYLFWIGVAPMMRVPPPRAQTFQFIAIGALLAIGVVVGVVGAKLEPQINVAAAPPAA